MAKKQDAPNTFEQALEKLPELAWAMEFKPEIFADLHSSVVLGDQLRIGEGTKVDPFVMIEDNVIIGDNCLIRSGALIRSGTVIGNNCVIGHNAEIKHAFICDQAKVSSNAFVGDSIIGYGARIASGVIIGNRRFDQQTIAWSGPDGSIKTDQDKLGIIVGDYTRLGANVTTSPGAIVGAYTWVASGNVVAGFIDTRKYIKPDGSVVDNQRAKELLDVDNEGDL